MSIAVLAQDGQLPLPREIRERLGVRQGDRVELSVEPDGSVRLRPETKDTAAVRNGVPVLPARPGEQQVTLEIVNRLRDLD